MSQIVSRFAAISITQRIATRMVRAVHDRLVEPGCGAIAKGPFPFEDPREGQAVCANLVCQHGWLLDFDAHRCPGHAKQLMSVRNLIQSATRIPDLGRTN